MKISIITASYNYAEYLEELINSVINQSYQDWELIIVDDGSSDNSVEIIKSFCQKDNRVKLFQHQEGQNKGLKETLLLGLSHATGDWVAFLESDDFFMSENLSEKVKIIEQYTDVKLIFNKVGFIGDEIRRKKFEKDLSPTLRQLSKFEYPRNLFYEFFTKNMILTFSCVMVEKKALEKIDFNTPADSLLDWWLWIHLAYENEFYYIDKALTSWRIHSKSYIEKSKKPVFIPLQMRAFFDVYKNNPKDLKIILFSFVFLPILFVIKLQKFLKKVLNKLISAG